MCPNQITFCSRRYLISSSEYPNSARICSVCSDKRGRRHLDLRRRLGELGCQVEDLDRANAGLLHLGDHLPVLRLLEVRAASRLTTSPEGMPLAFKTSTQWAVVCCTRLRLQQRVEQEAVALAGVAFLEAGIGLQFGDAQLIRQVFPLLLLVGGDVDIAIFGLEHPRWARR